MIELLYLTQNLLPCLWLVLRRNYFVGSIVLCIFQWLLRHFLTEDFIMELSRERFGIVATFVAFVLFLLASLGREVLMM